MHKVLFIQGDEPMETLVLGQSQCGGDAGVERIGYRLLSSGEIPAMRINDYLGHGDPPARIRGTERGGGQAISPKSRQAPVSGIRNRMVIFGGVKE
jgi:hypothetical protein